MRPKMRAFPDFSVYSLSREYRDSRAIETFTPHWAMSALGLGFNRSTQQFVEVALLAFRSLASCVAVR